MIFELAAKEKAAQLFGNWEETLIWSCLQGIMGKIYGDHLDTPESVMAVIGDFAFFAGTPNKELISYKPDWFTQDCIIMVPQNERWTHEITQTYGSKANVTSRYAIKKEPWVFDKKRLTQIISSLPKEYTLCMIDESLFKMCRDETFSSDLVSKFHNYDSFKELGLGIVILKNDMIVSGASSYSRYREGIEIEIDTRAEYRRKGLASVCGAKLILECLNRNLYPSWDAQNKASVALAEKLGYHYSHTYTAIEIFGY